MKTYDKPETVWQTIGWIAIDIPLRIGFMLIFGCLAIFPIRYYFGMPWEHECHSKVDQAIAIGFIGGVACVSMFWSIGLHIRNYNLGQEEAQELAKEQRIQDERDHSWSPSQPTKP